MATRTEKNMTALAANAGQLQQLTPEAQVRAVDRAFGPPSQGATNALWIILIGGLLAIVAALTVFVFLLEHDAKDATDTDVLVPILTFIVGGLVGLFAPSPTSAGGAADSTD